MSTQPGPPLDDDLSSASSAWSGPNERTASVDRALVRIARALDAVALNHQGRRPKRVDLTVESSASSLLEFDVTNDGRWSFQDGSWVDGTTTQRSTLLRPTVRGIARATRPAFDAALDVLVRDVELVCAQRIAIDTEASGGPAPAAPPAPITVDELLEAAFADLTRDDRAALRAVASAVDLGAGTTIIVEGTPGTEVMFLLAGRVAVDRGGDAIVLAPGSVVGEQAALTGRPRNATVRTLTDVVLLVMPARALASLPQTVVDALDRKVHVGAT